MKYLKDHLTWDEAKAWNEENYYDADLEFKKLLTNVLTDVKYSFLELEDDGIEVNKYSFNFLHDNGAIYMLGGYEWKPKMGQSSLDKYVENCLLSSKAVFNVRKWMYGDIDNLLLLDLFILLPAQTLGRSKNLISDSDILQTTLDCVNRLGYKYYLDFNSISSRSDEKPLIIKLIIKQPE